MSRRRFFIIHNPTAGRASHALFAAVLRRLDEAGCEITAQIAESADEDAELARAAAARGDHDAVVAAGGDSTIRGTALGLLGTAVPLGIIPAGTGNVMAAELGLPRSSAQIARYLRDSPVRKMYCACANGTPFLLMAGAGFDARVVSRLNFSLKRVLGRPAYAWPILATLRESLPRLRVEVDGRRHEARWAIVANAAHYAGSFRLDPETSIFKQELTVILFQPATRTALAGQLLRLATGRLAGTPGIAMLRGRRIRIEADDAVPLQLDGEHFGTTPVSVATGKHRLSLLVPAAAADSLPSRSARSAPTR